MAAYAVSTTACIICPAAIFNALAVEPHGEKGGVTQHYAPPKTISTIPCGSIQLVPVTISYPVYYMGAGRGKY